MFLMISCLLIGISFISLAKLSFWRSKCSKSLPGKELSFFNILGDFSELIMLKNRDTNYALNLRIVKQLANRCDMFRKQQLFCMWGFYTPLVFLVKAGAVKEVLKGNKLKEKSWVYEWLKPAFGCGILTSSYSVWKPRRKLLNRCFHPDVLRGFLPVFNDNAKKLLKRLQENKKESLDITHFFQLCALDIICETVFDVKMDTFGNVESQYFKSLSRSGEIFMKRIYTVWLWPEFIFWNAPIGRELKFHLKVIKEFTKKVLQEKKERYFAAGNKMVEGKCQSMLDILLEMHLGTHELTEQEVEYEMNTFILAGHDTVAIAISWTLFLIGHFPEVQAKIHEELDKVFGAESVKEATEDDINQLLYLDCVLKESHRLYPPVPLFGREVEEDTTICGHSIPKGASCYISAYFLHRDDDVFPDPEKFDPQRFSPENAKKIPEFAYLPFSGGPRNCIGYKYAILEVKILLSTILRNFSVESLDDRDKILPVMHIALLPSMPIYMKFRSRKKNNI